MAQVKVKKFKVFPRGLTIAYIGDGKGKTTAAVGAAVRARGYGMRVAFLQFYKSLEWPSGERSALKKLGVHVEVLGKGFVGILGDRKKRSEHTVAAVQALERAWGVVSSGQYDLVVLDEVISCLEQKLFPVARVTALINKRARHAKAKKVHIVLTGHTRFPAVLALCDLVTEMKMMKHPYYDGFLAVRGVDF
ncbi:MAG: cob(I)yrinic acid a,c-diamide adenosyltransferase [Patescibacteria group bacterium]